jgi:hypothetical protein
MPTWDDLLKPPAPAAPESADRFCELSHALFGGAGIGKEWLDIVRARADRAAPAGASEAVLREREAVRAFVQGVERARDRGADAAAKAKKTA